MIRKDKRTWEKYETSKEWKDFINTLSKEEFSKYQSFRGYRGNVVKVERKIDKLKSELKDLQNKRKHFWTRMTKVNGEIDHLRKEFNISVSISYWKKDYNDKHTYFVGTVQRSGYKKIPFNLGNIKTVEKYLMEYYINSSHHRFQIKNDLIGFVNRMLNKQKPKIRELIRKDKDIKSIKKSLTFFFPTKTE